jgi:hypothetical protein
MHKTQIPLVVLFVGLGLVCLSFFWADLFPSGWTEEQAKPRADASANLHALQHSRAHQMGHAHGGETPGEAKEHSKGEASYKAFEEAKEKYDQSTIALEKAQHAGEGTAAMMKWLGIALVLGGTVAYYQFREKPGV